MKRILHLISSLQVKGSHSIQLGRAIVEKIQKKYPGSTLEELNLVDIDIPGRSSFFGNNAIHQIMFLSTLFVDSVFLHFMTALYKSALLRGFTTYPAAPSSYALLISSSKVASTACDKGVLWHSR